MWPNPQDTADLVTFTEKIRNGKLYFFLQWIAVSFFLIILTSWDDNRFKRFNSCTENSNESKSFHPVPEIRTQFKFLILRDLYYLRASENTDLSSSLAKL